MFLLDPAVVRVAFFFFAYGQTKRKGREKDGSEAGRGEKEGEGRADGQSFRWST